MTSRWAHPAIVSNPTKSDDPDSAKRKVLAALRAVGLPEPRWYDTTAADPGRGQATEART